MSVCVCVCIYVCVCICVNAYLTTQADRHLTRKAIKGTFPGLGVRHLRMTKINIFGVNIKAPGTSGSFIPVH